jgi:hypothetical protein
LAKGVTDEADENDHANRCKNPIGHDPDFRLVAGRSNPVLAGLYAFNPGRPQFAADFIESAHCQTSLRQGLADIDFEMALID